MKKTLSIAFFILIFSNSIFSKTFTSADKKGSIEAYGVWNHNCIKGAEQKDYTIHDNQSDKGQIGDCALTFSHSKCKENKLTLDKTCPTKWKFLIKEKVLFLAKMNNELCYEKGKKLANDLVKKGFTCSESGIN